MRWDEESNDEAAVDAAEVVDVAFRLSGRWLPVDHARALRTAVVEVLPWLEDEPAAGIHSIHGAASGNGWERPGSDPGGMLNLSRRTPLVLRVPGPSRRRYGRAVWAAARRRRMRTHHRSAATARVEARRHRVRPLRGGRGKRG